MSREVDPNDKNLSEDDKKYLVQRGLMPTDVMSVADQRELVDPEAENTRKLRDIANTGTVNTAGLTIEELEAELKLRREAAEKEAATLTDDDDEDDDEDSDDEDSDYASWTKAKLQAEIASRNEGRDEEDLIVPASDKNADLAAALEADDEDEE